MVFVFVFAALGQIGPGPIDGFRANLASVKVSMDFQCRFYYLRGPSDFVNRLKEFEPGPGLAETPTFIVEGRWEHDGTTEHHVLRLTGGSLYSPGRQEGPLISCEAISDGETIALHHLTPGGAALQVIAGSEYPLPLVGPLVFYTSKRFDREIFEHYNTSKIERNNRTHGDYPTEVEVYEKTEGPSQFRREISYDSGVGYLPRFFRGIVIRTDDDQSSASVKELYLVDALPCTAGGFVPTEWYLHNYNINDFNKSYNNYTDATALVPTDKSTLIHFKATDVRDMKEPVRLDQLSGVNMVLAPGGALVNAGDFSPMTLGDLKTQVGPKLKRSNQPVVPNIDYAEKYEFEDPPRRSPWLTYLLGGLVGVAVLTAFVVWRRSAMFLLLIGCCIASTGCGQRPVARLTAGFTETRLIYDPSQHSLPMTLVVNNVGNQTLRIFKVDAGCSCRHIDPTQLPATLEPGNTLKLAVQMSGGNRFDPQNYIFTFNTDQGPLTAPVPLFALPSHHLSPQSVTLGGLSEISTADESTFELVHRAIYDPDAPGPTAELDFPSGFVAEEIEAREGRVAGAPEYAYKDTTYRVALEDDSLGLNRANIVLRDLSGQRVLEAPVVWQRLPFLASTPDRVVLSARPVRVFLRCPDETVELARVLSSPEGVKAVIASPREVTVTLTDEAPGRIDGVIEVETTAQDRPPLRVSVVRYAPLASR